MLIELTRSSANSPAPSKNRGELKQLFGESDPLGYAAGDINLLRYVNNDPTEFADPTGLDKAQTEENKIGNSFKVESGDIRGKMWIDADVSRRWPDATGFRDLRQGAQSANPRYTGVWLVLNDKGALPTHDQGSVQRVWLSAYAVTKIAFKSDGKERDLAPVLKDEQVGTWRFDETILRLTNKPLILMEHLNGDFWDGPGLIALPGFLNKDYPAGITAVYERAYAVAVFEVSGNEIKRKPIAEFYYIVSDERTGLKGGGESSKVTVVPNEAWNKGIIDWSKLAENPRGSKVRLKFVDAFSK